MGWMVRNMIFSVQGHTFHAIPSTKMFWYVNPPPPLLMGLGLVIWFFCADLHISCNSRQKMFLVLDPYPNNPSSTTAGNKTEMSICVYACVYKSLRCFAKSPLYRGLVKHPQICRKKGQNALKYVCAYEVPSVYANLPLYGGFVKHRGSPQSLLCIGALESTLIYL